MPAIITGLPLEAVLWVVGIFICAKVAKCLAVDRVPDETGDRGILKRYLTIEQCRSSERLQLD
ncbi:hypothetical protein CQ048_04130 [Pseudomonas trivialis]|nr:hypothetical protein CQ048_04130 [Pseudomonas trivialis]PRB29301.1 hypothetical protein CQ041_04135 [Pseudomonas sp. MYb60]